MYEPTDDDRSWRPRHVGRRLAAVAAVLLALVAFVWLVGVEEVLVALAHLRTREMAPVVAAGLLPLVVWGIELRLALDGLDVHAGTPLAVALFAAAGFLNSATPLGELGGDPPSGLLIARACRVDFARGLATIVGVHVVNRVAVVALGVAGVAWIGPGGWVPVGGWTPLSVVVLWTAIAGAAVAAWVYREAVVRAVGPPLDAVVAWLGRRLPLVDGSDESAVQGRLRRFVGAIERLAADPRRLLAALLLGAAGHLAVTATLWLALAGLGVSASVPALLVVIPLAKLAGLSPTPGGAGSATVILAGLLVAVAGVPGATATAAALVYRTAAFLVPAAVGALVTVGLVWTSTVE